MKKETKDFHIGIRVTPTVREKLVKLRRKYKENVSEVIAKLIMDAK